MRPRLCLAVILALPMPLLAQSSAAVQPASAVGSQFLRFADAYGGRLVAAFDSIPESRYDYRPTPVQQSIGYIAQHLEHANYSLCGELGGAGHPRTAKDALPDTVKARWPKDTLVARLAASLDYCDAALARIGALTSSATTATLIGFETDLAEHYSQIAGYMRLLGMVPPSALPPRPHTAISLPASTLVRYVGTYQLVKGLDVVVTRRDTDLFVQSVPGGAVVRLWPESAADFFVKEVDAQISFTRNSSGAVSGLVVHQFGRDRIAKKMR